MKYGTKIHYNSDLVEFRNKYKFYSGLESKQVVYSLEFKYIWEWSLCIMSNYFVSYSSLFQFEPKPSFRLVGGMIYMTSKLKQIGM